MLSHHLFYKVAAKQKEPLGIARLTLSDSMPQCHLKMTNKSDKFEILQPFFCSLSLFFFALAYESICIKVRSTKSRFWCKMGNVTVCRHVCEHYSAPEILHAGVSVRACMCVCRGEGRGVDGCVGWGLGDLYAKYVSCSIKLYFLFGRFVFVCRCTSQCVLVLLFYICLAFYGHLWVCFVLVL